jgi:hypothetical protein
MNKRYIKYFFSVVIVGAFLCTSGFKYLSLKKSGKLTIYFENIATNKKIYKDSIYQNPFGEIYSVSKLKYYISNIKLNNFKEKKSYHLIDAFTKDSININLPTGNYNNIQFLVGVDSLMNCSGAQAGALDPLNDMFWTWNSGYVMFKMEGISKNSNADNNRIEQHIGGYKGMYKTMREIKLSPITPIVITENNNAAIIIQVDLDKYWDGINKVKIAETPVNATIGAAAKNAADNFPAMFTIKSSLD